MRQTPLFRLLALAIALIGSLSAPTLALAHGHVHAHVAHRHGGDAPSGHDHSRPAPAAGDHHDDDHGDGHGGNGSDAPAAAASLASVRHLPSNDHAHGHPRLDSVQGVRDLIRLPATHETAALVPAVITIGATQRSVRAPARTDRVLLARPAPERGPPPTLRAPPTR